MHQINEAAAGGDKTRTIGVRVHQDHGDGTTTVEVRDGHGAKLRAGQYVRVSTAAVAERD